MASERQVAVTLDDGLADRLQRVALEEGQSISTVIQRACASYLDERESEARLDAVYEAGYRSKPEAPVMGEAQSSLLGTLLEREDW